MAKQKLTTVITYNDNTQSSDNSDMQDYAECFASYYPDFVNQLAQNMVGAWDTCDVTMEIDGETFHAYADGNRHERDTEYEDCVSGYPWHNCHDTQPSHECRVLLAVNDESEGDWDYIPAYWDDGRFFSGYNAVHPVDVYKYAYWRYIDAPQIKED